MQTRARAITAACWLVPLAAAAAPAPALAAEPPETATRAWWDFHGNEYWRLFFPGHPKDRPKPAAVEHDGRNQARVLTIESTDREVTVGVYGGNRREDVSLIKPFDTIDFTLDLESGPAMDLVLTLRDAEGEKWRFVPKRVTAGEQTVTWSLADDVEEIYHGDPQNKAIDERLHLFNFKLIRPASSEPSRVVFQRATVTEFLLPTDGVELSLRGSSDYPVVFEADRDDAAIVIDNAAERRKAGTLRYTVTESDGAAAEASARFDLAPGASEAVPLTVGLDRYGVKTLSMSLVIDGHERVDTTKLAYFDPVGNDAGRGDPFGFAIGGAQSETDYELMAAIGVEGIRMGRNWVHNERKPGEFHWGPVDREVEAFARHGFDMQYLVSYGHPAYAREPWATELQGKRWPLQTAPPELDAWKRYLRELSSRYDGKITRWEIWNEPDLSGFWKGSTDDYIELLAASRDVLKSVNPRNRVMTGGFATAGYHGGQNLNPDLQERVLTEHRDLFDIHTHHQHGRFRGFQQAIDGPLAAWRSGMESDKPLVFNETALAVSHVDGDEDRHAAELVKKMSFAFARGAESYAWFVFFASGTGHVAEFAMIHGPDHHPRPALVAYNELARQLRDAAFVRQVEPGTGRYVLHFADAAGSHRVVLWHEDGDFPQRPLVLGVPAGASVARVDLMGNAEPVAVEGGVLLAEVGPTPYYLRIDGADAAPVVLDPPLRAEGGLVTTGPDVRGVAEVTLANPAAEPQDVSLAWALDGEAVHRERVTLGPRESRRLTRPVALPGDAERAVLAVRAELGGLALRQTLEQRVQRIQPIASAGFTGRDADFVLDDREQLVNWFQNDPANLDKDWAGPDDLSGRVWLRTTADALEVMIRVTDDVHQQPHDPANLWRGDSVQLGLTTLADASFWEFGLARSDAGEPMVRVFRRPGFADRGRVALDLSTQRSGATTEYRVAIPWTLLGADAGGAKPELVRFNVVINDSDKGSREGLLRLRPGIDQDKDPEPFVLLRAR